MTNEEYTSDGYVMNDITMEGVKLERTTISQYIFFNHKYNRKALYI